MLVLDVNVLLAAHRDDHPDVPTPLDDALGFVHAVRWQPGYVQLDAGARHLDVLAKVCADAEAHRPQ